MAKYRVIEGFYDLQDPVGRSFHLYDKGDEYPREGLQPSQERIEHLLSDATRRGAPVIEAVEEDAAEPSGPLQDPVEVPESSSAEKPKPKRRRAKADK